VARVSPLLARLGLMEKVDRAWIEGNDVALQFSSQKARRELGWKPRCNTSAEVVRRYVEVVPGRLDRRIQLLLWLIDASSRARPPQVELKGFRSRVHLALTGPGGGDISITIQDQRLRARAGAPEQPTAVVTLPAALFLDLVAGRADYGTAQLTGRVRCEGEGHAALLIGGIVTQLHSLAQAPGARGRVGKLIQRIIGGGPSAAAGSTA
jgi:hypothetical protein